jgi:hypothetical protein
MATAERSHGNPSSFTRDTLSDSSMQYSYRDKLFTVSSYNRRDQEVLERNGSWLPTRARVFLLILSVVFSFIIVLSRSRASALWPESFLRSQVLKAISHFPSHATSHEKSLPGFTPTAFSSNGRTDQVQWDSYTLILQGQRVLI